MDRRTSVESVRTTLQRVRTLLDGRPDLAARYEAAKAVVRAYRKTAFYEVTQRCNLKCEGCYYFEGGPPTLVEEQKSPAAWDEFFAAEAHRGVSMAYFVGAEPALEQERLISAASYFPYGNIGTNGTIRIDSAIPYRIGISIWAGDDVTDRELRGASVFRKAFRNYEGDPRAIILYTLSPWNLNGARTVAEMCREHDLPLTFNMYSPTTSYLRKLHFFSGNDDNFFRVSRPGHTPCFSADDLQRTERVVDELMNDFPDTVIYLKSYSAWITRPKSRYALDPAGIATDCGSRIIGNMRYYGSDLQPILPKCCTPAVDCSQCRMYSGGWSSKLQISQADLVDERAFSGWMEMMMVLGKITLYQRTSANAGRDGSTMPMAAE